LPLGGLAPAPARPRLVGYVALAALGWVSAIALLGWLSLRTQLPPGAETARESGQARGLPAIGAGALSPSELGRAPSLSSFAAPRAGLPGLMLAHGFVALFGVALIALTGSRLHRHLSRQCKNQQRAANFLALIDQVSDALMVTDPSGRIQYVNRSFEAITGYDAQDVLGQTPRLLQSGKHDHLFYEELWQTLRAGQVWSGRIINRRRDGQLFTEDCTITPVLSADAQHEHYVAQFRDVSVELQMEQRMRHSTKMATVGRLAASVAHDFNNLLSPILGYADSHRQDPNLDAEAREAFSHIAQAAQHAREVVRQLLSFSRKQELDSRVLDLREVLRNLLPLIQRTLPPNIELSLTTPEAPCPVQAVQGQLEQVIMNLVVNARDAMPDGGVLHLALRTRPADPETADEHGHCSEHVLTVTDTGVGMDDALRQKIFDPFFSTKGVHGTGLGLTTVSEIIRKLGGTVSVASALKRGSTFELALPIATEDAPPPEEEPASEALPPRLGNILVVDDDPLVRRFVARTLRRMGHEVTEAGGPREAEALLASLPAPPQVVLTDLVMPGTSGRQLAAKVRGQHPECRVVLMTGQAVGTQCGQPATPEELVLRKPFTTRELHHRVQQALRSEPSPGERPSATSPRPRLLEETSQVRELRTSKTKG